ncbi:hypothetical protein AB6A40_003523 [Gnathostoma spinigerum]|uniref:Uncharacterized protein n=1 Tax=Gnathostoma spinigerum TaxID=75299 RepID=A0ABD6E9T5_9BILA
MLNQNPRLQVLEGMAECKEFTASRPYPKFFPDLSDVTLNRWAIQNELPTRVFLQNVYGNFTLDGVLTMINAYQVRFPALFASAAWCTPIPNFSPIDWNFGCVRMSESGSNILELMSSPGLVISTSQSDYTPNILDVTMIPKRLQRFTSNSTGASIKFQLLLNVYKTN